MFYIVTSPIETLTKTNMEEQKAQVLAWEFLAEAYLWMLGPSLTT